MKPNKQEYQDWLKDGESARPFEATAQHTLRQVLNEFIIIYDMSKGDLEYQKQFDVMTIWKASLLNVTEQIVAPVLEADNIDRTDYSDDW